MYCCQGFTANEIAFGETQHPQLWDYADGINTLRFFSIKFKKVDHD